MKTNLPISSISYCDKEYLKNILDGLILQEDIKFYAFIFHFAEKVELKNHIHLYIEPCHRVDTEEIKNILVQNEFQGTISFKKSHFDDWFLYSVHNKEYLEDKGLLKNHFYSIENFVSNDSVEFLSRVENIDLDELLTTKYKYSRLVKFYFFNNKTFGDFIAHEYVPLNLLGYCEKLYSYLEQYYLHNKIEKWNVSNKLKKD